MKNTALLIAALAIAGSASAQVYVSTGFEANALGNIAGQAAEGGRIWQGNTTLTIGEVADNSAGPTIGNQSLRYAVNNLAANANSYFCWIDIFDTPAVGVTMAAGNRIIGDVMVYVNGADTTSLAGNSAWTMEGNWIHGLMAVRGTGEVQVGTGSGTGGPVRIVVSGLTADINAWNHLEIITEQVDANTIRSTYRLNGQPIPGNPFHQRNRTATGAGAPSDNLISDFDLYVRNNQAVPGGSLHRWDNYRVRQLDARQIAGRITLSNYVGDISSKTVTVEVEESGSIVETITGVPLTAIGTYVANHTRAAGSYNVYVKGDTFLRKLVSNVTFDALGAAGVNAILTNGDINGDNEVGPADFSLLSAAFGSFLGDPNYSAAADLNGDEEVGPADFAILSASFGEFGD